MSNQMGETKDMYNGPYASEATPKFVILYRNGHEIFRVSRRVKGNENSPTRMAALTAELNEGWENKQESKHRELQETYSEENKTLRNKLALAIDGQTEARKQVQSLESSNRWLNTLVTEQQQIIADLSAAIKNTTSK